MTRTQVRFKVIQSQDEIKERGYFYLIKSGWDDWFAYSTTYRLFYLSEAGKLAEAGFLKIGEEGLVPAETNTDGHVGLRMPTLPVGVFESLGIHQFSLGQDASYYKNLHDLNSEDSTLGDDVLTALRDVAFDEQLWNRVKKESVTQVSLLRDVSTAEVEGQFRRIARGGAVLTPYKLRYTAPKRLNRQGDALTLTLDVVPNSIVPSNLHVLIGRNGVGKTYLLSLITKSLVAPEAVAAQSGRVHVEKGATFISNLITMSFSAFDGGELYPDREIDSNCSDPQ